MRPPGQSLLGAALALCALAIGWLWIARPWAAEDLGSPPPAPGAPVVQGVEPMSPSVELEGVQAAAATLDPQRVQGAGALTRGPFNGPEGPFQLSVRVLDAGTREPLEHYLVAIALTGRKNLDEVPPSQRLATSDAGECHWPDLDLIGPWDVSVGPIGYEGTLSGFGEPDRVATVMGHPVQGVPSGQIAPGPEGTLEVLVETGPRVTYRGSLPRGVELQDLRFDLRGRINPYSSRTGDAGGPARGRVTPEGWVTAAMPRLQNALSGPNFGIRIWTADGNFGLVSVHSGKPSNTTQVVIEEPLRARAKVRFRVELLRNRDGALIATPQEIAESLQWEVSGSDPERESRNLPPGLLAGPWSRGVEQVGPDTFEIGDLAPTTVTFRGWRDGTSLSGRVHPPDGIQATASHGDPSPSIVRLSPVE